MDFFPFFRRPYYYSVPFQNRYMQNQYQIRKNREEKQQNRAGKINEAQTNNINTTLNEVESRNNENSQKILGFNSDDVLIIVLLLFLYNEGVRDNMLFLVLILLLLT